MLVHFARCQLSLLQLSLCFPRDYLSISVFYLVPILLIAVFNLRWVLKALVLKQDTTTGSSHSLIVCFILSSFRYFITLNWNWTSNKNRTSTWILISTLILSSTWTQTYMKTSGYSSLLRLFLLWQNHSFKIKLKTKKC